MLRSFTFLVYFSLLQAIIVAQAPMPCGPEGEMEPFCDIACIICDIDGFFGVNDENEDGIAPDDFCTSIQHNIQWIAFIAGTEDLTLRIDVGSCESPTPFEFALEVAVYEAIDCDNFRLVTPCNGQINQGTSWSFSNTEPLTIGQYYFFVMDGSGGSVCDYRIHVEAGSTKFPELGPSAPFDIPNPICANQPATLSFQPQVGATIFEWTIDGVLASNANSLEIDLFTAGLYDICITESNACNVAIPYCTKIEVQPQIFEEKELVICDNTPVEYNGIIYDQPGVFEFINIPAEEGCDSIISLNVFQDQSYETNESYNICEGDTLVINGVAMFEEDQYDQLLTTDLGCDSTILIELGLIVCNMEGSGVATNLVCHGDGKTGSITFRIDAGTPPFIYNFEKVLDPSINGNGTVGQINVDETIVGLPSGTYLINVFDTFGNTTIIIVEIFEPTPIQNSFEPSDINGLNISCFGGNDGSLTANVLGGTPPYMYTWSSNSSTTNQAENLRSGMHTITITDANGCIFIDSYLLSEPNEIDPQVSFLDPNCESPNSGLIQIGNVIGGTPDFEYSLNGSVFSNQITYGNLSEGEYSLVVLDANGCLDTVTQSIFEAEIPEISFVDDITINLGESVNLIPIINDIEVSSILWIPEEGLSCNDCLEPDASPVNTTTYLLQVESTDGCLREESITVFVEKDRGIFAPNVFSPNADAMNQYFFVTGGNQINQINTLHIYDRWGNNVFKGALLNHKIAEEGWDGLIAGNPANIGVYTWIAEVEFLDGFTEFYTGDVLLIR